MPGNHLHQHDIGWSVPELLGAVAAIAEVPPHEVCEAVVIFTRDQGGPRHEMSVIPAMDTDVTAIAAFLRHAAAHIDGTCKWCFTRSQRSRHAGG
jgi:hypothetical protein